MAEAFGCCSSYVECSNKKACVHKSNPEYATCQYRKNLESGRIFYGSQKSKTIQINEEEKCIMSDFNITIKIEAPYLSDAINHLAEAISGKQFMAPSINSEPIQKKESKAEKSKKAGTPVAEPIEEEPKKTVIDAEVIPEEVPEEVPEITQEEIVSTYTLEEVRSKLADLSKSGKSAEVKNLIAGFGAGKLTDIPADKYSELMAKADKI